MKHICLSLTQAFDGEWPDGNKVYPWVTETLCGKTLPYACDNFKKLGVVLQRELAAKDPGVDDFCPECMFAAKVVEERNA